MTASHLTIHRSKFVDISTGNITALAFSHKSSTMKMTSNDLRLAIGRSNGAIEIWNPRANWFQELLIQSGKDRSIESLCWRNVPGEGLRLFSIGGSTVVTEWDLKRGIPLTNYDCNAGVIWSMSMNESQDKLSVGCDNGTVVIVDISGGPGSLEHDCILMRQEARILSLTWNGDDHVIAGCSDARIRVWSVQNDSEKKGRLLHTMKVDKSKKESTLVWSVLFLPKTNQIVSGDSTGSVKFWDFHYATLTQSFKLHAADVLCLTSDARNDHIFSAGVDRKIFQFSQNASQNQSNHRWVNTSNRLLHGNDVRAMCSYQSKNADFLVSGGVEKTLIVSSLSSFSDGKYRKLPSFALMAKSVLINKEQRFVVMWHESTVKIWVIGKESESQKNYRLICKLTLKDEQNISTCAMSPDGQVLVVARPSTTKLFHLQPMGSKLKVTKLDNEALLRTGCKHIKFIDNSRIMACSTDDEIFILDLESEEDEEFKPIDLPEIQQTKTSMKVTYMNSINHLEVNGDHAVIARTCGAIDLINIPNAEAKLVVRLSNFVTAITINRARGTLIITTAENKIFEFNIVTSEGNDGSLLTQWSKNNTDNLPKQFELSVEKCVGIFNDSSDPNKMWFWSPTWLSRFDFSVDLPVNTRKKSKKHTRDGLTITEDNTLSNDADEEEEENDLEVRESLDIMPYGTSDLKLDSNNKSKTGDRAFFFTEKYRPLLFAGLISEREIFVVERPGLVNSSQGAYDLPKILF